MLDPVRTFNDRDFHLDCIKLELYSSDDRVGILTGAGFIDLLNDGMISFRCILNPTKAQRAVLGNAFQTSSEDAEPTYTLKAFDTDKRQWETDQIRIKTFNYGFGEAYVVDGILGDIHCSEAGFQGDACSLFAVVPYTFDFPQNAVTSSEKRIGTRQAKSWSLDAADFETEQYSFLIRQETGRVHISVESKHKTLPKRLQMRLLEALVFVSGRELEFSCVVTIQSGIRTITLISTFYDVKPGNVFMPIYYRNGNAEAAISLFTKYFDHIIGYELPVRHPLSRRIFAIRRTSSSYLSQQLLEACRVAEGLIDEHDTINPSVQDSELVEYNNLLKCMDASLTGQFLDRAKGVVSLLKRRKTALRLKEFANMHALDEGIVESWDAVRNKEAHGHIDKTKNSDDELILNQEEERAHIAFQRLLDILFLVHCLIVDRIGYSGVISNNIGGLLTWPESVDDRDAQQN